MGIKTPSSSDFPAPFILASQSPRRKQLLRQAGFSFRVIPSRIREPKPRKILPAAYARKLALAKTLDVAKRFPEQPILGADTIVVLKGKILGKPKDLKQACQMLSALQGTTHRVITAVAWKTARAKHPQVRHAVSTVTMRRLTDQEVVRYARKHQDKAGAYAVQDKQDPVVNQVLGSTTNVVGLPMEVVRRLLNAPLSGNA